MSSTSTITYTSVYTDSEPGRVFWGADEELYNGGSPRVIDLSSSPDYVPGPEHPPSPVEVPYVPKPEYPRIPKKDHADYPADGGDDDDEPSDDNDDDDDTDDEDEEASDDEEEEHLAPADPSVVPAVDHVPPVGDTKAFETDKSAATPKSPQTKARIYKYAAAPTPPSLPPSPLSPWGSSTAAPRPTEGHRVDYGFISTLDAEPRCQRAEEVGYRIRDVWVDPREAVDEVAPTTLEGVNARVTELAAIQEQDTKDIYAMIEDAQDRQTQLSQRVDGQLSATLGQIQALQARDPTHADDPEGADTSMANNMPPKRTSATTRAAVVAVRAAATATATAPMTVAAVEQLIEARVSAALANHETL
ncbi:hypothetical protein Tco_0739127 [Tanacetum coccineum]